MKKFLLAALGSLKAAFLSRKYLVFVGSCAVCGYALLVKPTMLTADSFQQVIIWLFVLYFGANVTQRAIEDEGIPANPLSVRMASRKFISTSAMICFLTFALVSKVLPEEHFVTVLIWINGLYYGADVGEIFAYKTQGLGGLSGGKNGKVDAQAPSKN